MKKIVTLIFSTVMSCVLFAQQFVYEWEDVTPDYFSMTITQSACTKGGKVVAATQEGWLAESPDTGKTWNPTYNIKNIVRNTLTGTVDIDYQTIGLQFAKDSLHGIYTSMYEENEKFVNNILYTSDGGSVWKSSDLILNESDKIVNTTWRDDETAFITVYNTISNRLSIYRSNDKGINWSVVTTDALVQEISQNANIYMAFVNNQLGYIFTKGAYCVTKDGGETWTAEKLGITPAHFFQFANGYIILTVENRINKTLDGCRIINMYDGGNSAVAYYYVPQSMYDLGDGKVWASVSGGQNGDSKIMSYDSMKTWQVTNEIYTPSSDITTKALNNTRYSYIYNGNMKGKDIFVKSKNEIFIIGEKKGRLFYTFDGGKRWSYKDFNTTLYTMQFISDDIIYMSSTDSLFISRDGGKSWIGKNMNLYGIYGQTRMKFFTESFGYIYDEYYLYQTLDGGNSWNRIGFIDDDDFLNYDGTLNGYFANNHLGLFRSANSKTILVTHVNSPKSNMTCSLLSEDKENRTPFLSIMFYDDKWILTDKFYGYIYTCDTISFDLQKKWYGENYTPVQQYSSILPFSKNTLVLPMLSENPAYTNDKAIVSTDGGNTWNIEQALFPCASKVQNANDNTLYAIPTDYNIRIYKGIHKVKNSDFSFEKQENGTIQCSISNAENQTYTAKVLVEQVNGTTIVVQDNVEIKSGEAFVITLPQNITANYVIKVIPEDEEVYETVQSQEFIVNNGGSAIDAVFAEDIQIRVVNGKIECSCEEYAIYNVAGQKVQNNAFLPSGTYFVHYGTQVKKVVVK
ncbi:MAG: hypothetical protein IK117_10160 [Bacteroidales bacterium]|nr:hypothetical protein [Bacteroidales bacterium]